MRAHKAYVMAFATILIAAAVIHSHALELRALSIDQLVKESDLIIVGKVTDADIHQSWAKVEPSRQFPPAGGGPPSSISIVYKVNQFFGPDVFRKGGRYLLFLSKQPEGFATVNFLEGVAPVDKGLARFYFGEIDLGLAESFVSCRVDPRTPPEVWDKLGEDLIKNNERSGWTQTATTFQMLSVMPDRSKYESVFAKGLNSMDSRVVYDSMRRLADLGSDSSVATIVDFYFRLKKNNSWQDYRPQYVLPYQFNEILQHAKAHSGVLKLKEAHPDEEELFKGI
jgi:hypothetical protein